MQRRSPCRWLAHQITIGIGLFAVIAAGCNKPKTAKTSARRAHPPTVASLVPAATDLILGIGAGDHLAAVSNFDGDPAVERLPRVGDYERQDWEKLEQIGPDVLITNYGQGPVPQAVRDRARELGMRVVNLKFNRLSDIYESISELGGACNEPAKAAIELRRLKQQIESVRAQVAGEPRVRAAIATGPSGRDLAGRQTYLDDLLEAAGGENAVATAGYVSLDPESLAALKPQVVLLLMPGEDAAAVARVRKFWTSLPDVPAVKEHRICPFTKAYIMLPGSHVAEVAEQFAQALHPQGTRGPSTTQSVP